MSHNTEAFRQHYRAAISRWYNPWMHGGFVLAVGAGVMALLAARLDHVRAWEWLAVPISLLLFLWGQYVVHRNFGHHKVRFARMFYQRHAGDHHSFFDASRLSYEQARDWRVIFFPAWLIVLYSAGTLLAGYALSAFNPNVATLFCMTLIGGYLSYEILHACEHLPSEHWLARLPWIRHMRQLHRLHHRRDLMQTHNFDVVIPLMDWLYGTLHWEPIARARHDV